MILHPVVDVFGGDRKGTWRRKTEMLSETGQRPEQITLGEALEDADVFLEQLLLAARHLALRRPGAYE